MGALAAVACGSSSSDATPSSENPKPGGQDGSGWPGAGPNGDGGEGGSPTPPVQAKPPVTSFAELKVVPFDVDREDLSGPKSHDAQYGKLPEIVPVAGGSFIDLAVRNTDESAGAQVAVVRVEPDASGAWRVTRNYQLRSLGWLLGFARGADGSYYYATGTKDPDVTKTFPAPKQYRANVVRALRFDPEGKALFDIDVDTARPAAVKDSEPIVRPGTASSSRLSVGGNVLGLFHGINTEPDSNGTRHQKATSTFFDASSGAVRKASSIWVSHSFDQRHLVDGNDIYEAHLGDAYPRAVVMTRVRDAAAGPAREVFRPKGDTGANNTFTRLGNLARIDAGPASGSYLALIATERTTTTGSLVSGSRDLALVRLTPNFATGAEADVLDRTFGAESQVTSGGKAVTNRLLYLTDYDTTAPGKTHAERPKLVSVGNGEFIVLWEQWTLEGDKQTFNGTFAMRIDGNGKILAAAKNVSQHHLPRGDDAVAYGGGAAWVTGDKTTRAITVHRVAPNLDVTDHTIP
ncbi:hypothetical protein [Pendulispora albinea]|uniref:Lipoprotein n=1 Tax=Pendulispora albinea TaxID=2741071 RepID=A0ABZ2M8J3_9BACT